MKIVPMEVAYVDHMGSDLSVVNSARVSFHKESDWEDENRLSERDAKLINYLAKHNHWTPFAHTAATLRIKAPLFVARQLGKHQVGFVWNEVSRRYVDEEPEFFFPDVWRERAENVKQGSSDEAVKLQFPRFPSIAVKTCLRLYLQLISEGVAPEQARMILPQNLMTEWWWTGSLAAWARVCNLRLDEHTQKETRDLTSQIVNVLQPLFPASLNALCPIIAANPSTFATV